MIDEIFGSMGCFFLSLLMIPQVHKTYKCKDVSGISAGYLWLQFGASSCMGMYGLVGENLRYPVIISNAMILLNTCILGVLFKRYRVIPNIEE